MQNFHAEKCGVLVEGTREDANKWGCLLGTGRKTRQRGKISPNCCAGLTQLPSESQQEFLLIERIALKCSQKGNGSGPAKTISRENGRGEISLPILRLSLEPRLSTLCGAGAPGSSVA